MTGFGSFDNNNHNIINRFVLRHKVVTSEALKLTTGHVLDLLETGDLRLGLVVMRKVCDGIACDWSCASTTAAD